jgi:chromosome segregation protein
MKLEKIKLSGFKSFVDSTTVLLPSALIGVVGPNGCGKSNIIDAVRWVMGESSAKYLRGDSSTDVIFNGSAHRHPVEQSTVELVFDNSDRTLTGELASYNEIAIRRQVNRDAVSIYYLNGVRCRKRDIAAIFLGTGLGPRSYSIIQQGMVSQLIEAKPEELRTYIEEAAGISKYKARRRETENRIKHTRENLERLADICLELEKQLSHLKRQAASAERFKKLKEEERLGKADLSALRWDALQKEMSQALQLIEENKNNHEKQRADLRCLEVAIEQSRESLHEKNELFNAAQEQFYALGNDIGRVEQGIEHQVDKQEQLQLDLSQADNLLSQLTEHQTTDKERFEILTALLAELQPRLESLKDQSHERQSQLNAAESAMQVWQSSWDSFTESSAKTSERAQVEQARIQQLEERLSKALSLITRNKDDLGQIQCGALEQQLKECAEDLAKLAVVIKDENGALAKLGHDGDEAQKKIREINTSLEQDKNSLQRFIGREASLEALQQAALGQHDENQNEWLSQVSLKDSPRFVEQCTVNPGWEKALEMVLGTSLQAVCVPDSLSQYAEQLNNLSEGEMFLVSKENLADDLVTSSNSLAQKVSSKYPFPIDLNEIFTVETLEDALLMRANLKDNESVITIDGVWFGQSWMRVNRSTENESGVIARSNELKQLAEEIKTLQAAIEDKEAQLTESLSHQKTLDELREASQERLNTEKANLSECNAKAQISEDRLTQLQKRQSRLSSEIDEANLDITDYREKIANSRELWEEAMAGMAGDSEAREVLQAEREDKFSHLTTQREKASEEREKFHQVSVELETTQTEFSALENTIERSKSQLEQVNVRRSELQLALSEASQPLDEMREKLQGLLDRQVEKEKRVQEARQSVTLTEEELRNSEDQRHVLDKTIQEVQQTIQAAELSVQSSKVRQQTLVEQLQEENIDLQEVLKSIDSELTIDGLSEMLDRIGVKVQRLGAINLAAIDEYKTHEERKNYLDQQNADLEQALAILEEAIAKIDKETRAKFKETYDFVNKTFQHLFPKVFEGGSACLELTGNDLLDSGIVVMARPPGKRNSTIHLLSGGEKALTAIALVFSIFQLNPAPFCLLDEVDAPLDDANVKRFCEIVKEMSAKTQFIVITHNKVTMEMTNHLLGVTMHEPGVSRLVSVDIEEAVAFTE